MKVDSLLFLIGVIAGYDYAWRGAAIQLSANQRFHCLTLSEPENKFSMNHWFHVSEHYLSRVGKYDISAPLLLLSPSERFVHQLTPFTMFLLVLSLTSGDAPLVVVQSVTALSATEGFSVPVYVFERSSEGTSNYSLQYLPQPLTCATHLGATASDGLPVYQWFKTSQNHDHHSAAQDKLIDDAVDHNVATLRHRVNALCPSPPSSSYDRSSYIHTQSTYPQSEDVCHRTLLVYQRDKNRDIADLRSHLNALVSHLQRPDHGSLCSWQIRVLLHSDQAHPCQLHHDLSAADVLLTSHSFQEIGLIFMRSGSTVIEAFPYKYFKKTYQALSASLGLRSFYLEAQEPYSLVRFGMLRLVTTEFCMAHLRCRGHAREASVMLTDEDELVIVHLLRQSLKES